jgi:hypothetical protein
MNAGFQLIPLGFAVAGLLFAAVGVSTLRAGRRFERTAQRASGTVTDVRSRAVGTRRHTGLAWIPVVRFQTADGRTIDGEASGGTNLRRHEPGQTVEVVYDPGDPARFRVGGTPGGAVFSTVFIAAGVLFAFGGLVGFALFRALG